MGKVCLFHTSYCKPGWWQTRLKTTCPYSTRYITTTPASNKHAGPKRNQDPMDEFTGFIKKTQTMKQHTKNLTQSKNATPQASRLIIILTHTFPTHTTNTNKIPLCHRMKMIPSFMHMGQCSLLILWKETKKLLTPGLLQSHFCSVFCFELSPVWVKIRKNTVENNYLALSGPSQFTYWCSCAEEVVNEESSISPH